MSSTEPGIDPISLVSPEAVTSRQREVARLVAEGRTNTEIAEELGITLDGAKYHVSELLTRLGLRRREEVAEWYRAHFGPVARLRRFMRGLVSLPTLGLIGSASAVGGVIAVSVIAFVALRGASAPDEIGPPDYVPFVQEWEITRVEEPTREATLEWNGCGEWEYREANEGGQVFTSYGRPPTDEDPGCNIPSFWFRPIDSFRGDSRPGAEQISPFEYSYTYTRDCSEISNPIEPDNPYGPDFCSEPGDTFEDRVVVEFDSDTLIPMRYSQYLDGVLASERRATSLRLLDADEVRVLATSESLVPPDATPQVTAVAIPQDAGTFETLLQWVPEGYGHALTLGDMEAWRDLVGVEAPDDAAGEEAYLTELFTTQSADRVGALNGPLLGNVYWYLGVQTDSVDSLKVSTQTEEAFGFGIRDVDAFATVEQRLHPSTVDPTQSWGIVAGDFSPDSILDTLAQCGECEPAEEDSIVANPVYSWGDDQSFSQSTRNALPIFDDLGRGGTMAFFDNRVMRSSGLDQMRVMLESTPIASDPTWTRAAQIFDDASTLYAHFQTVDELSGDIADAVEQMGMNITPRDAASLPPLAPYRFMALGGGAEDGVPFSVLLLAFEDSATAAANVDVVRERLEAIPDGASPQHWGDPEIADVASDGALVVVRLEGRALGGLHLWMMQTVLPGLPSAVP